MSSHLLCNQVYAGLVDTRAYHVGLDAPRARNNTERSVPRTNPSPGLLNQKPPYCMGGRNWENRSEEK